MKKTFINVILFMAIGCLLALIFNYYNSNVQSLYSCEANNSEKSYIIYTFDADSIENQDLKCNISKKIKGKTLSIIGNTNGYTFNDKKLLLVYNKSKKTVTVYDTNDFSTYDTVKDVEYKEHYAQRKPENVALYNDNLLFAFIFPKKVKTSYADLMYNIEKKQIVNIEEDQEFYRISYKNYYNLFEEIDINSDDRLYSNSKYITSISDGLIIVNSSKGEGVYDLINNKYVISPQKNGHFLNNNGFIFIGHDRTKADVKFYNYDGKLIFSNDDDNFAYKQFVILNPLDGKYILLLGNLWNNNIVLLNSDGSLNKEYNININRFKNDVLNKITNSEAKNNLTFYGDIAQYYSFAAYNSEKKEIVLTFVYENSYYSIREFVNYTINLNNNTIN